MTSLINKSADWPPNYHKILISFLKKRWHGARIDQLADSNHQIIKDCLDDIKRFCHCRQVRMNTNPTFEMRKRIKMKNYQKYLKCMWIKNYKKSHKMKRIRVTKKKGCWTSQWRIKDFAECHGITLIPSSLICMRLLVTYWPRLPRAFFPMSRPSGHLINIHKVALI